MSPMLLGNATLFRLDKPGARRRIEIVTLLAFFCMLSAPVARGQTENGREPSEPTGPVRPYLGAQDQSSQQGSRQPTANAPASTQALPEASADTRTPSPNRPPATPPPTNSPYLDGRSNESLRAIGNSQPAGKSTAAGAEPSTTYRGQWSSEEPIPLEPPDGSMTTAAPPKTPTGAMWTVATSLAIVLGLFFVVVYVSRRAGAGGPLSLPKEAFDVLGRAALAGRQQAQVVRFGDKLILLAVSATGVESLAEITSPEEVERVAGLCEQRQPGSVTQSFQQVLHQFSREKTASGFIGSEPDNGLPAEESVSEFEKLA